MGGDIFDYDLRGSGGMPPPEIFVRQLSETKILIELLNICG